MYNLDTKEEVDLDWFMEALENNEIQLVSRKLTKEDDEKMCRAIAEYEATHPKTPTTNLTLKLTASAVNLAV
jgi:hypothetical protein